MSGSYSLNGSSPMFAPSPMGQDYSLAMSGYGGAGMGGNGGSGFQAMMPDTWGRPVPVGAPTPPAAGGDWLSGMLGSVDINGAKTQGWGAPALGAAQGVLGAYMGMKQYGLYKDQLNESKRQFGLNYDAQRQTTNASLNDRQEARVASNPNAYQSVGDYMAQYGIRKG